MAAELARRERRVHEVLNASLTGETLTEAEQAYRARHDAYLASLTPLFRKALGL